jgi:hypothetical protein
MSGHCIDEDCGEMCWFSWMVKLNALLLPDGVEAVVVESGVFLVEGGWRGWLVIDLYH